MAMSSGNKSGMVSDINVTPLVDVMLVLLIIFMVTAPIVQQGVDIDLPEAKAENIEVDETKLILFVTSDEEVYLGKTLLGKGKESIDTVRTKLVSNARLKAGEELYFHADKVLQYGFVVRVLAIIKEAGVENLSLVTDPLED